MGVAPVKIASALKVKAAQIISDDLGNYHVYCIVDSQSLLNRSFSSDYIHQIWSK
jgi:hypothetical protein